MAHTQKTGGLWKGFVLAGCLALLGILAVVPAAYGQAADQYIPQAAPAPTLDEAGVIASGGRDGGEGGAAGETVAGEAGAAGGGELPFTGYPLTPLLLLIAALLLAGLILRFAAPSLDRKRRA